LEEHDAAPDCEAAEAGFVCEEGKILSTSLTRDHLEIGYGMGSYLSSMQFQS
jgi:hypothetical protein